MTNRRSLIINTLLDHLRAISTDPSVYTANAIANVTDGRVDTLIFDNRGRFYDEGISRTLIDFEALRAEATATVANGSVTAITLTEPGKAYDFVPNVTIEAPDSASVIALASASRSDNAISSISVNNSGTFYLTPPSVTVSDPPGYSSDYARFDSSSYYIHGETVDYLRISTGDVLISQGGLTTLYT